MVLMQLFYDNTPGTLLKRLKLLYEGFELPEGYPVEYKESGV